jgi:hypothetical protein
MEKISSRTTQIQFPYNCIFMDRPSQTIYLKLMGHPGLDVRTLQKSKSLFNINLIGFRYTLELTVLVIFFR